MKTQLSLTLGAMLLSSTALADAFTDAIVADLQANNFDYIEVKDGISQVKVEAVRGNEKIELVYDRVTGAILKRELEPAEADEIGLVGVDYEKEDSDFLDDDDLEDDESDDDEDDDENDDDEDDDEGDDDENDDDEDDDDEDDDDSESDDESDSNDGGDDEDDD